MVVCVAPLVERFNGDTFIFSMNASQTFLIQNDWNNTQALNPTSPELADIIGYGNHYRENLGIRILCLNSLFEVLKVTACCA